jgi:hypothetical protein
MHPLSQITSQKIVDGQIQPLALAFVTGLPMHSIMDHLFNQEEIDK